MFACGFCGTAEPEEKARLLAGPVVPVASPVKVDYWKVMPSEVPLSAELRDAFVAESESVLIEPDDSYTIEVGNQKLPWLEVQRTLQFQFPEQDNHFHHFFQDSETYGGETEIGWVLISHTVHRGDTLLLIRDLYANKLYREPGELSVEQFIAKIKFPIRFASLKPVQADYQSIVSLDDIMIVRNYKFGVLYAADGQEEESAWLDNNEGSEAYEKFLDLLGERIELRGWEDYKGGLDVESGTTGEHSVFQKFNGKRLMFHVGTLLPFDTKSDQQIARKRHIGNDIVVIIFKEAQAKLKTITRSQFNHIYIVVQEDTENEGHYIVEVARRDGVDLFVPAIPFPSSIPAASLQKFILYKALNGEWAAYRSPQFHSRLSRARQMQLQSFIESKK